MADIVNIETGNRATLTMVLSGDVTEILSLGGIERRTIGIVMPATASGTITLKAGISTTSGELATFQQVAGTDMALTVGKSLLIPDFPFSHLQIQSSGIQAAERLFSIIKVGESKL